MSRNAIKYQPFKPLDGHEAALREKERNLEKVEKPILSEDECIRINDILVQVISENICATFCIFKKDKIIQINSRVNKVMDNYLYLEDDRLLITDVTNIII